MGVLCSRSIATWRATALVGALLLSSCASAGPHAFEINDYFRLKRFVDVALSGDGGRLAYVLETYVPAEMQARTSVHIGSTKSAAEATEISELSGASQLAWFPSGELAFLSKCDGGVQVHAFDPASRRVRRITNATQSIIDYEISPRDGSVAYLSATPQLSLYDRLRRDGSGIIIDTDTIGYRDLMMPEAGSTGRARLWVTQSTGEPIEAVLPGGQTGRIRGFHWSSDGRLLSVAFVSDDEPASIFQPYRTSLAVCEAATGDCTVVARSRPAANARPGTAFVGGEWVPGQHKILVRRITESHPWLRDWGYPEMAVLDVSQGLNQHGKRWIPVEVTYFNSALIPTPDGRIYLETAARATRSLFELRDDDTRPSDVVKGLSGSSSSFRFSADFRTAVFINESLERPPELYIWHQGQAARQLSHVNVDLAAKEVPGTKQVSWRSRDGELVSGWLMMPPPSAGGPPWPLITYVHGGPGSPFENVFAPAAARWGYPLEVYALRGMAVFAPNYRGTGTFGLRFALPTRIDREPVDDIVSGIDALIQAGIADPQRLGLSGHSHGAWLGPMTATRARRFKAGSFAEGWSNQLVLYELQSGLLNRDVHEAANGELSVDADPRRYLELSPDLHFEGMRTALLLEAGAEETALHMLGMAKAARRIGIPQELVLYPLTGHTMTAPRLLKESMDRNLDWFQFWLLGDEDYRAEKTDQYRRWRKMRDSASSVLTLTAR